MNFADNQLCNGADLDRQFAHVLNRRPAAPPPLSPPPGCEPPPLPPEGTSAEACASLGARAVGREWHVPERDARGGVVGTFRWPAKRTTQGSTRGLVYDPEQAAGAGTSADNPLFLVEGFTDTAAGIDLGLPTLGRPSASGGAEMLIEFCRLRGIEYAVLVGENDGGAGRTGAESVARKLRAAGIAATIIFPPSGIKDLRAWKLTGATVDELRATARHPRYAAFLDTAEPAIEGRGGSDRAFAVACAAWDHGCPTDDALLLIQRRYNPRCVPPWDDRASDGWAHKLRDAFAKEHDRPFGSKRADPAGGEYVPFPTRVLPPVLCDLVTQTAAAIGCDEAGVALPMLSVLASAAGNTCRIRAKADWWEPLVLWTAVVVNSGRQKSPAFDAALKPLADIQARLFREHRDALETYRHDRRDYEQARRAKTGEPPVEPTPPTARRCLIGNTTMEAMLHRLGENPRGLLAAHDELDGLVSSFDAYRSGRGGDTAAWLSMHRAGAVTVDRKGGSDHPGGSVLHVPAAAVSLTGTIQPRVFARAMGPELRENGFLARLLVAYPPPRVRRWSEAEVSAETKAAYATVVERLFALDFADDGFGGPVPRDFGLTPDAKGSFRTFVDEWGAEQDGLSDDLSALWSKLEGAVLRFALVIHLVKWASEDPSLADPNAVDLGSLQAGISLARWFGNEGRRVYAMLGRPPRADTAAADPGAELLAWIAARGGSVTARDLARGPRAYQPVGAAETALNALVAAGLGLWVSPPPSLKGGRPTRRFHLRDGTPADETRVLPKPC